MPAQGRLDNRLDTRAGECWQATYVRKSHPASCPIHVTYMLIHGSHSCTRTHPATCRALFRIGSVERLQEPNAGETCLPEITLDLAGQGTMRR